MKTSSKNIFNVHFLCFVLACKKFIGLKMGFILKFTLLLVIIVANNISKVHGDASIQLACLSDEDCDSFKIDFEIDAKCIFDSCSCFLKNGTEKTCSPRETKVINEIPRHCPCEVLNSQCLNGKCVCKEGFIRSRDKIQCISKVVPLGKSCASDDQCQRFEQNTACINYVCQCKDSFVQVNNKTCRSLVQREKEESGCSLEHKCGPKEECFGEKCVCNQNYVFGLNKTVS
jgi:hypothetical protein